MLFDAHTRSFQALGGVTRRGIYDNMRTAVDKVQRGKKRVVNARFAAGRAATTCLILTSAMSLRVGRKVSSRRMCKTAAAWIWIEAHGALAPS